MADRFLFERRVLLQCSSPIADGSCAAVDLEPLYPGIQAHQSPDDQLLAVIGPGQTAVTVVDMCAAAATAAAAHQGNPPGPPPTSPAAHSFTATAAVALSRKASAFVTERFTAVAWSGDSTQLLVAGLHGSLYLLDRLATVRRVWLASGVRLPWTSPWNAREARDVVGLALPAPGHALLATSDGQVYSLRLGDSVQAWEAAKPAVKLKGVHQGLATARFCHAASLLVLAGPGGGRGKPPGACISLWRWDNSRLTLWKAHGKPQAVVDAAGLPLPWTIALSPANDLVAVVPGSGRLVVLSLKEGALVDWSTNASGAGRVAEEGTVSCAPLAESCAAVTWWAPTTLALASASGTLGLGTLPTLLDTLGPPESGPTRSQPGTMLASLRVGDELGLLLVEPQWAEAASGAPDHRVDGAGSDDGPEEPTGWALVLLALRTPERVLALLCDAHEWAAAASLCRWYGMDEDAVLRAQWAAAPISSAAIKDVLGRVQDAGWAVQEALSGRAAPDAAAQRALLRHALDVTAQLAAGSGGGALDGIQAARAARRTRLRLLGHVDRLDLLLALHAGLYEADAYVALRDAPLVEVAQAWAAMGDVPALGLLLAAYPATLGPHVLTLLSSLPETLDPRSYAHLLPRADGSPYVPGKAVAGGGGGGAHGGGAALGPPPSREPDWVESALTARELVDGGDEALAQATEPMAALVAGPDGGVLPSEEVEAWYCERAVHLDVSCRQLPAAAALLELGLARGASGAGPVGRLSRAARLLLPALGSLVSEAPPGQTGAATGAAGHTPAWLITLDAFAALGPAEQLALVMASSQVDTVAADITERAAPLLLSQPGDAAQPLVAGLLGRNVAGRPEWCLALVRAELRRPRLLPDVLHLAAAVMQAVSSCPATDVWPGLAALLGAVSEGVDDASGDATSQGDMERQRVCEQAASSLQRAAARVTAGATLAKHGVAVSLPALASLDGAGAQEVVQRLLAHAERSAGTWGAKEWGGLWADLKQLQGSVLGHLALPLLLQEYVGVLLRAGRPDLATPYLKTTTGSAVLPPGVAEQLVVAAACELLAAAPSLDDPGIQDARALLALAPPDSKAAQAELALLEILERLAEAGVPLLPAQVKAFQAGLKQGNSAESAALGLLAWLLQQGAGVHLHRHLDTALELAGLLGLDADPGSLAQAKVVIAQAAGQAGDWAAVAGLVVALAEEGVPAAAPLAAALAKDRAGLALDAAAQRTLLRHAALHAPPADLPSLLDALLTADIECAAPEVQDLLAAPSEYHFRRALSVPGGSMSLPSGGDVPLALATLAATPSAAAAEQLVRSLLGGSEGGATGPEGDGLGRSPSLDSTPATDFATLQRITWVGVHGLAMRALHACVPPASSTQLASWQALAPLELLQQAEEAELPPDGEGGMALAAAQRLSRLLQAAVDGRAVKAVAPSARTTDFLAGSPAQRLQALLQQAAVAGQQAAGRGPDGAAVTGPTGSLVASGTQLLDAALALAVQYGVPEWHVRACFLITAMAASRNIPPELRHALVAQAQALLRTAPPGATAPPAALLLSLLSSRVWPELPPTSAPHLSLAAALVSQCLAELPSPPPHAQLRLGKLCDLVDKAGGALQGLALAAVLHPLIRSALGAQELPPLPPDLPPGATDCVPLLRGGGGGAAGLDPDVPRLTSGAHAALLAYATHATVGATSKLLKALQAMFAPPSDGGAAAAASANSDAAAAHVKLLASLPPSLPYLCLLCKAGPRLDADAWAALRGVCADRVTPGQLRAWLDFALLGGKQPLSSAAAGKLAPPAMTPDVQLAVVRDGLALLPEVAQTNQAGGAAGGSKPLPSNTRALLALYGRLCVLRGVRASPPGSLPDAVIAEQEAAVAAASTPATASAPPSAAALLSSLAATHVAHGTGLAAIVRCVAAGWPTDAPFLAAIAAPLCGLKDAEPAALVAEAVRGAQRATLEALAAQAAGRPLGGAQHSDQDSASEAALRSLVLVLRNEDDGGDGDESAGLPAGLLESLRLGLLDAISGAVDRLEPAQYGSRAAAALLEIHMSLLNGEAWPGWQPPAVGAAAGPGSVPGTPNPTPTSASTTSLLAARLLLASSAAHLNAYWGQAEAGERTDRPNAAPSLTLEDVQGAEAATAAFLRLVTHVRAPHAASQLACLHTLLSDVWKGGAAFTPAATASGFAAHAPHEPSEGGQADQPAGGTSYPLEACWRDLLRSAAEHKQHALFLSILAADGATTASATKPFLLSERTTAEAVQDIAALAPAPSPGDDTTPVALAVALALSSPYASQRTAVAAKLLHRAALSGAEPAVALAVAVKALRARLLGDTALGAEHRMAVQDALVAAAMRSSGGLVLPAVVAQLVIAGRVPAAAALAAHTCRWTSALRALGGSLIFLTHFLGQVAQGLSGGVDGDSDALSTDVVAEWVAEARVALRDALGT